MYNNRNIRCHDSKSLNIFLHNINRVHHGLQALSSKPQRTEVFERALWYSSRLVEGDPETDVTGGEVAGGPAMPREATSAAI